MVPLDAELGNGPDHLPQEVDNRADVEELGPQGLHPQVDDLQADGFGPAAGGVGVTGTGRRGRQRSQEVLAQLEHARRPDLLGEVATTRPQHPADLRPAGHHRMTAHHQVERRIGEGQRPVVGGHDGHAAGTQPRGGPRDVRRPGLRGHRAPGQPRQSGENLPTAGLNVQAHGGPTHPLAHQPGVAPGRTLLGGPPVQPGEVPAVHRHRRRLSNKIVELARHRPTMAAHPRGRERISCAASRPRSGRFQGRCR